MDGRSRRKCTLVLLALFAAVLAFYAVHPPGSAGVGRPNTSVPAAERPSGVLPFNAPALEGTPSPGFNAAGGTFDGWVRDWLGESGETGDRWVSVKFYGWNFSSPVQRAGAFWLKHDTYYTYDYIPGPAWACTPPPRGGMRGCNYIWTDYGKPPAQAEYRVDRYVIVSCIPDDKELWEAMEDSGRWVATGAPPSVIYNSSEQYYPSGVPRYAITTNVIVASDPRTGEVVAVYDASQNDYSRWTP